MFRITISLLISSLLIYQGPGLKQTEHATPYEDSEAYQVYSAILPLEWPSTEAKAKMLVIRAETTAYEMCLRPDGESRKTIGPAIEDYVKQNGKTRLLQRHFALDPPYELITDEVLKSTFEHGSWVEFYKEHPDSGGSIELSAVGFNADKTVAVVYMGHSCGLLCGGGGFHVLEKKGGKWAPLEWKGTACFWAS
jgi:hypothetical protein